MSKLVYGQEGAGTAGRRRPPMAGQRGIVLVAALILAVLYFALMELMMLDASRALQEAQRYRSRVIAETLAESAAELAARQMIQKSGGFAKAADAQGSLSGTYVRNGCCNFELTGDAETKGVPPVKAHVRVEGRINGNAITIDYARHSP